MSSILYTNAKYVKSLKNTRHIHNSNNALDFPTYDDDDRISFITILRMYAAVGDDVMQW